MRSESDYSHYLQSLYGAEDQFKLMARSAAESIQASHMCLSPEEGRILRGLLSLSCSSVREGEVIRVVEIGTLTGLSAHYLLDAFPAGLELWTFELQLRQAELARQSHRLRIENEIFGRRQDVALALKEKTNSLGRPQGAQDSSLIKKTSDGKINSSIHFVVGDAKQSLRDFLQVHGAGTVDFVFIDANKADYPSYLEFASSLLKPGGCLVADNCFLRGDVFSAAPSSASSHLESQPGIQSLKNQNPGVPQEQVPLHFSKAAVQAMQDFNQKISRSPLFEAFYLPTSEGLCIAKKRPN